MSYKEIKKDEFAKETEVVVSDFDDTVKILTFSGVNPTSFQENYREKYVYKNSEIVIDTWPWLLPVVEVESPNEEELNEITGRLDLDVKKSFKGSINNVYKLRFGKSIEELTKDKQMKVKFEEANQFLL